MATETVHADWLRDRVFLLRDRADYPIVMTQPAGVNGADLLPLSLIGCAAWDIMDILQKQRQQVTGLSVSADSLRDEEPPWRFRRIHIHYRPTGHNLNENRIQRAIELAETRYCSIHVTLRSAIELSSSYEVVSGQVWAASGDNNTDGRAVMDSPDPAAIAQLVTRFNDALNAQDVETMMGLLTEDCVFENTWPPPDGTRYEGQQAVRDFWETFFHTSRAPRIEVEEIVTMGERCTMRWTYRWLDEQGTAGHVRGVDVYRVRDGRIAEKLSYVKG